MTALTAPLGAPLGAPLTAVSDLIRSGRAVDGIMGVIALEFVILSWRARRRSSPVAMLDRFLAFAPGLCLLLALRLALAGAQPLWIAGALAASFPFHLADLARRRI